MMMQQEIVWKVWSRKDNNNSDDATIFEPLSEYGKDARSVKQVSCFFVINHGSNLGSPLSLIIKSRLQKSIRRNNVKSISTVFSGY